MRIRLFSLVAVLLATIFTNAQSSQKVSGRITDETGTAVVGASVIVDNSGKGVTTDVEGNFFVTLEKNRKYTIQITSVGFETKKLTDVEVTDKDVPTLNVSLVRATKQLQGLIVTATARKEAQSSIYVAQKNSSSISDGISAEIIKRSPDKNTGEVLKRVSGASVQDNKFVIIRGLRAIQCIHAEQLSAAKHGS